MAEADEKLDGGPSVLFDAVALPVSEGAAGSLAKHPSARDFVADAFAHQKFIAYQGAISPLFEKSGIAQDLDYGGFELKSAGDAKKFVQACARTRYWERAKLPRQAFKGEKGEGRGGNGCRSRT